jgi:hypothetical protein
MFGIELRARLPRGTDLKLLLSRAFRGIEWGKKGATWSIHPAARVQITTDERELLVRAQTAALGPGYQLALTAKLDAFAEKADLTWEEQPDRDLASIEADMCAWVAEELAAGTRSFGMVKQRTFLVDAPVLTPLGPRDAAWRDAVIADPARGADAFPWWQTGPGHAERARALIAMWLEIPWRDPVDDEERAMMERVHDDLLAARRANPDIDLPWADWAKLLEMLGEEELAEKRRVRAGDARPSIGYRRYDMDVELSGGWSVCLPGAFLTAWDEDRERFWGSDGERTVEFTSFSAQGEDDSDRLLAVAPERHPVVERMSEERRRGRVEMYDDFDGVRIAHGLMTVAPHVAILTIKGGDDAWALATWRSLHNG